MNKNPNPMFSCFFSSTKEKLTVKQLKELLRGVQLAMFSKVYNAELRSPTPSTSAPDGSTISRSVFTLGQVVITGTGFSQENIWVDSRHGFKLNRNMVRREIERVTSRKFYVTG